MSMTATVIDSTVFRNIFSSEPMRQVFSDEHRVQCYLDIEAALARVQACMGPLPQTNTLEIPTQSTHDLPAPATTQNRKNLVEYPGLQLGERLIIACADNLG